MNPVRFTMVKTQAEVLARMFHEIYEEKAPEYGYKTRKATRTFDPDSPNGKLMIATCEELIRSGEVMSPVNNVIHLSAVQDGRRSSQYPDVLYGWQFLGFINKDGKPPHAPLWVAERFRYYPERKNNRFAFKASHCQLENTLEIGDWLVRDYWGGTTARVWVLPAATISRWYVTG